MEKRRKNIRLPREAYEVPLQIFSVTLCTQDRRPLFQNGTWAKTLLSNLETGPIGRESERYAWCLMADHLQFAHWPARGEPCGHPESLEELHRTYLKKKWVKGGLLAEGIL